MKEKEFDKKKYDAKFIKTHYKQYAVRFNSETEKEIIDILENQSDKKNYIKTAILEFEKNYN